MNKDTVKKAIGRFTAFRLFDTLNDAIASLPTGDKVIDIHLHPINDGKWVSEVIEVVDLD